MTDNRIEVQFAVDLSGLSDDLSQANDLVSGAAATMQSTLQSLGADTSSLMSATSAEIGNVIGGQAQQQVATQQAVYSQLGALHDQFSQKTAQQQQQNALDLQRQWQQILSPITHSIDQSILGMINGTTTLQQAVSRLAQSMLSEFLNLCTRSLTEWLASELAKTAATETGAAERAAADQSGQATSLAGMAEKAISAILNDAASTFAGVFAFLSPEMGPAAAGPAAASSAVVSAVAGDVVSAAGGYVVPQDMLAMVHQREVILPAHIADRFINASGAGGNAAPAVHFNVTALDANGVARFFKQNGNAIAESLKSVQRNFKPGFARV